MGNGSTDGLQDLPGTVLLRADYEEKFQQWLDRTHRLHRNMVFTPNSHIAWSPRRTSLSDDVVALVSTAGVRLRSQPEFDLLNEEGDWSVREIPGDVTAGDLVVTHNHYDTSDANADPNVVFPIDRLRELVAEGAVGRASDVHIGMMGWNPNGSHVRDETAPAVAARLKRAGATVALLTPG